MTNKPNEHLSAAVLIEKEGNILLVRQAEREDIKWGPPAGHLEPGENFTKAAKRETREETGLEIELINLVGIYTYIKSGQLKIGSVFRGQIVGGKLGQIAGDIVELRWFSREEVQKLITDDAIQLYKPEYNLRCLADWLAGQSFPLNILKENL